MLDMVHLINARRLERVIVISLFLSVCALFRPYNSKTITPIELKFGGQVFYGVQTDSFKFGVICVKTKARRVFLIFNWAFTVKSASLSVHHFALITQKL